MEDITDVDHRHAKRVFNEVAFKILNNNNLGNYYDLYGQSDTLLLADVFENVRNMSIEVYQLDLAHFSSAPGLAWQACLRKTGVKIEMLTNPDMLLMVEKGIRGRMSHATHRGAKANNKYMKNYNKDEKESFLQYNDANNLYGFVMSEPLPADGFEWMEDLSKIYDNFIKKL